MRPPLPARAWPSLALFLAACGSLPTGTPASTVVPPANWQGQGGRTPVAAAWWTGFGDATLDRLVDRALANNKDLLIARRRIDEARALLTAQHGAEWPAVDAGIGRQRARSISPVTGAPYLSSATQAEVDISYEVDLWGRLDALDRSAAANLAGSEAARDTLRLAVAAGTTSTYIGLRALDARLALAEQTLGSRRAAIALATEREAHGYTSKLELAQAESEYRATAHAVSQLAVAVQRQEHALCLLLGEPPGAVERGAALVALAQPAAPDIQVPSRLLRQRPDIAQAEAQLVASDAQWAAARAQLLPALRLAASYGAVRSSILRNDPISIWSVGSSILAPLFHGGRLRAQADAASTRRQQALLAYEKTVLTAFGEVEDQLSTLAGLASQTRELEAQHTAVQDALRIARNRHAAGYASYLEELDAQRTLFTVEQTLVQARADLLVSQVNLYRALGGGGPAESRPGTPPGVPRSAAQNP
jgi:NodT family efflux transporter outer membrane factor (OMF) lipoprotein